MSSYFFKSDWKQKHYKWDTHILSLIFANIATFMGVLYCPMWIPITVCCPDILAWGVPFSVFLQGWCARGNPEMSYFLFISEGHFCWIVNSWLPIFFFQHVEYVVALIAGLSGVWWEAGHHLHRGPRVCHELILSYCIQDFWLLTFWWCVSRCGSLPV